MRYHRLGRRASLAPEPRARRSPTTAPRVGATLRRQGTCNGCPSSAATVKLAVERAILQRVPEIREVVAENITPIRDEELTCMAVEDDQGRVTISLGV